MTAVSSFNFGPEYMRRLFKQATKESPGKFTKRFICKVSKKRPTQGVLQKSDSTLSKNSILLQYKIIIIITIYKFIHNILLF